MAGTIFCLFKDISNFNKENLGSDFQKILIIKINKKVHKKPHNYFINRYNDSKMSILDKAKIGNLVHVNLELSKDRLTKEVVDSINVSSVGRISDFRITEVKA